MVEKVEIGVITTFSIICRQNQALLSLTRDYFVKFELGHHKLEL